jgi:hypothetical protein
MVESIGRLFFVHSFSDREKITFSLLKVAPHVKDWWETYCEKRERNPLYFIVTPSWNSFQDVVKEQYYPVGSYEDKYIQWTTLHNKGTKMCMSSQIFFILYTQSWVSKTLSDIWCSSTMLSTQIHSGRNGVPRHLLTWCNIPICCQD